MCVQWFPEPIYKHDGFHATHEYLRKCCGVMSLRAGSSLACALWIAINVYGLVLSIQGKSPIFSYLDSTALKVQAGVCAFFAATAAVTLQGLYGDSIRILHHAHRWVLFAVFLFLVDFLGNIIISGIQRDIYNDWCVDQSRGVADENISATLNNGTSISISLTAADHDIYNCDRLWVHEFEFALIVFCIFLISFTYWATCIWSYFQKLLMISRQAAPPPLPPA